jgi:phytoene dehydrogenase-like protein
MAALMSPQCMQQKWSRRRCGRAGLLCCGDSTFPGIGVPAVAASGAIAANTLVPVWDHWALLDRIGT